MSTKFAKVLRVGKRERYVVGIAGWLDGEAVTSVTVEPDVNFATLHGTSDLDGSVIGFFLDGVAAGTCKIHLAYTTATRSDCRTLSVSVKAGC